MATQTFRMPSLPSLAMPTLSLPSLQPQAKRVLAASGIAVAATGVAVATGVAGTSAGNVQLAAAKTANTQAEAASIVADRTPVVSRSLDRQALARTVKTAALSSDSGAAVTQTADLTATALSSGDPKAITKALMPSYGMPSSDFSCIDRIWNQESGWRVHAANPSGAYGIPQALPGAKMGSAGPDWQNNAETQIKWGLGYIKARYGSACNAAAFKAGHGWY